MGGGAWVDGQPDERHYRYSVKCDREMAQAIGRAAAAAGLSATAFVQRHFETILGQRRPDRRDGPFDAAGFAARHGLPVGAARIWHAMRREADRDGMVQIMIDDLADLAGTSPHWVRKWREQLVKAGLAHIASHRGRGGAPVYRIMEPA